MSTTRKPNAIEAKHEMNCGTCSLLGRCRFARDIQHKERPHRICRYYANPERGAYIAKRDERIVTDG